MKKKVLSIILALVMVAGMIPLGVIPAAAIGSGWTFYDTPGTYGYIRTREWTGESFLYYPLNSSSDFDTAFANVEYYQTSYDIVLLADYTANNFVLDAKALNINLNGYTLTVTGNVGVNVYAGAEAEGTTIFAIYGDGGNISFPNNTSTSAFTFCWDNGLSVAASSSARVKVQDVTFSSCKGRVFNADSEDWLQFYLSNARFENCSADEGSCLYVNSDETEVRVNGCQFMNCSATDGGAVYVDDISKDGSVEFSDTYAVNCHASGDGGFLYINDADAVVYGSGTTVIASCSAGDDGGAVYTPKASLIDGFLLSDNRAEDDGGAIFNESTWAAISTISNCRFYRNSCGGDGGALYNDDDNGTIKDCKFFENKCSGDGYELYSNDDDTLLTNCTFTSDYRAEDAVDGVTPSNCTFPDKSSYSLSTGDGSQGNPYVIRNIDDWDAFHYMVLNHAYMEDSSGGRTEYGTDAFKGKFVRLDADIPACNTIGESGKVLSYTAKYEFTGTFDGNGHTVTYVTYDMNSDEKAAFGYANGAIVKNLTVNGFVAGSWGIGGIFGHAENCTAENCVNNAEIYNNAPYTGGVAGYSIHTSFINCTNNGKITGLQEQVGGIAGYAEQDTFDGCVNNGDVYSGYQKCGGIAGYATNGNFNRCTNNAGVTAAYNYAGGIVSYAEGQTTTIKNCINRGTVTGSQYVGGFVGAIKNTTSVGLYNSVNDAAVNGNSNVSATISVYPDHSSVANCYFNSDLCAKETYAVPFSSDVMHGICADEYGRSMPYTLNYGVDHDFQANGWLHAAFNDNGLLEFVPDGAALYMGTDGLIHAVENASPVTGSMETLGVEGESHAYYVDGTVTTTGRVQILGDVTLVLNDDCNYYVQGGIGLEKGNSLTVYSYSLGEHMGSMTAAANQKGAAAIGGNATNEWAEVDEFDNHPLHVYSERYDCGDLTICGGNIEAVAYNSGNAYGVGIGGSSLTLLYSYTHDVIFNKTTPIIHESDEQSYCGGDGGNIAVYNGNLSVKATGAVGIGGGNGTKYYATLGSLTMIDETYSGGTGGTFAYYGGTVTVESDVAAFGKGRNGGGGRDDASSSDMTTFTFTDDAVHGVAVGDSLENLKAGYSFDRAPNLNGEKCVSIGAWGQTLDPTCEEAGHKAYVLRLADNLYYEDALFTKRIGNDAALQVWKAEGGGGYIPPLGHDWVYDNEDQHKCTRCGKTEPHTMGDDGCTRCNGSYYDYSTATNTFEKKAIPSETVLLSDFGEKYTLPGGWYLVHGDVTAAERVTFTGDVHLILKNGCTFTANQGIALGGGASLSIYAQSLNADEMGKLTVPYSSEWCAGIGSNRYVTCGNISIHGGVITATGGYYAAGIGSGCDGGCAGISVYGGVITATGGDHAAGIGSGRYGSCGDISIYGGVITATGDYHAAGIGCGVLGTCGDITIYDGNITATGGSFAAGIGSGNQSACGDITIYDGNVTAIGGEEAEGIGTYASGTCGTVTICEYLDVVAGADKDSAKPVAAYNGEKYVRLTEPSTAAKEPTCTENGHIEFYKNEGKYYSDKACTKEITDLALWLKTPAENGGGMLPATGHNWIEAEQNKAGTSTLKTPANCTDNAVYYKVCSVCDEISTTETWAKSGTAKGHSCKNTVNYNENDGIYTVTEECQNCDYTNEYSFTEYDYIAAEKGAYINTGYKPTGDTRVVMNVFVNGDYEYWFGVWDTDYNKSAFALGNDGRGIYAGYGNQGGTNSNGPLSNGYHTVEMNKNEVYFDGVHYTGIAHTYSSEGFPIQNTLYLFAQNRKGTAIVLNDQNTIHCYGCEIYEGDTLVHKFVPCKNDSDISGLLDIVNGVFCENSGSASITALNDTVETVSEQKPTCTENGHIEYYRIGFKYYSDSECANEITNLSAWMSSTAENGGGMIPATGHTWEYLDTQKHKCSVCKAEEAHSHNGLGNCAECGASVYTVTLVNTETSETVYSGNIDCTNRCIIESIANGTYIMTVSCAGMVARTYPIEVTDGRVNEEVSLNLDGDVNGDGVIDENDYQQAVNIALSSENAVDTADDLSEDTDYSKAVADFDKDGFVDVIDLALFERKIF